MYSVADAATARVVSVYSLLWTWSTLYSGLGLLDSLLYLVYWTRYTRLSIVVSIY